MSTPPTNSSTIRSSKKPYSNRTGALGAFTASIQAKNKRPALPPTQSNSSSRLITTKLTTTPPDLFSKVTASQAPESTIIVPTPTLSISATSTLISPRVTTPPPKVKVRPKRTRSISQPPTSRPLTKSTLSPKPPPEEVKQAKIRPSFTSTPFNPDRPFSSLFPSSTSSSNKPVVSSSVSLTEEAQSSQSSLETPRGRLTDRAVNMPRRQTQSLSRPTAPEVSPEEMTQPSTSKTAIGNLQSEGRGRSRSPKPLAKATKGRRDSSAPPLTSPVVETKLRPTTYAQAAGAPMNIISTPPVLPLDEEKSSILDIQPPTQARPRTLSTPAMPPFEALKLKPLSFVNYAHAAGGSGQLVTALPQTAVSTKVLPDVNQPAPFKQPNNSLLHQLPESAETTDATFTMISDHLDRLETSRSTDVKKLLKKMGIQQGAIQKTEDLTKIHSEIPHLGTNDIRSWLNLANVLRHTDYGYSSDLAQAIYHKVLGISPSSMPGKLREVQTQRAFCLWDLAKIASRRNQHEQKLMYALQAFDQMPRSEEAQKVRLGNWIADIPTPTENWQPKNPLQASQNLIKGIDFILNYQKPHQYPAITEALTQKKASAWMNLAEGLIQNTHSDEASLLRQQLQTLKLAIR